MNTLSVYNKFTSKYDRHMAATGHYAAQSRIVSRLKPFFREPILDIACGPGFLIAILSKNFKHVRGNDFSMQMIELAKKKVGNRVALSNFDALKIKSANKKFGTVISCNLFFYIRNKLGALQIWKKILSNKGVLVFIEEYPFIEPRQKQMSDFSKSLTEVIVPVTISKIIYLAEQAGFRLLKQTKTAIDGKHDLCGLVFKKSGLKHRG